MDKFDHITIDSGAPLTTFIQKIAHNFYSSLNKFRAKKPKNKCVKCER